MSYLDFHLWWTLPALVFTFFLSFRLTKKCGWRGQACAYLNAALSVLYTTPWDNYLVYKGIWFYGSDRVIGVLGYVPIEEYLFFILQSLTGSWFILWWWGRTFLKEETQTIDATLGKKSRHVGVAIYAFAFFCGIFSLTQTRSLYLGLILVWATPVLLAQWWFVGDLIVKDWKSLVSGFFVITLYLWAADRFAIAHGIWSISEKYTLGINFWGLPIEEALFFAVTNLLLVQGVVLFIHPLADKRIRKKNGPS